MSTIATQPHAAAQPHAPSSSSPAATISVVIPVSNQSGRLAERCAELQSALADTLYELIFVDDGSSDGSFDVLRALAADSRVRVVRLRRSFGRSAALAAGFARAHGAVVVTIDADGQTRAADILRLLPFFDEGYDLVSGWRSAIRQPWHIALANRLISSVTGVRLHDYGCPLKAYRADVVKDLHLYGDLYRFLPVIANWQGVRLIEAEVQSGVRVAVRRGEMLRSVRVLLDLITVRFLQGYSGRPMQSFGLIGSILFCLAVLLAGYLGVVKLWLGEDIGDRPLLLLTVLLVLVGVQFVVLGLLAELMIRIYYESQDKPIYTVREVIESGVITQGEPG